MQDGTRKENQFGFGGMDLSNNLDDIRKPDYVSAQNIDFDGSQRDAVMPFRSNQGLFTPEAPVSQNKIIRLDNTNPTGDNYTAKLLNQNNDSVVSLGITYLTFDLFVTAWDAALTAGDITYVKTGFISNETVTYEITGYITLGLVPFADWVIDTLGSEMTATTLQEPHDESLTKELQAARGVEILGKIYTIYTTSFYAPFIIDLTAANTFNSAGLMGITTASPHGLLGIEKVHITSDNAVISGDWIVNPLTATTFAILGLAFSVIDQTGSAVQVKVSTYIEIWRYTELDGTRVRLINTTKIPVRLQNVVDLKGQPLDSKKVFIEWVDGSDFPRYFEFLNSWITTDAALDINGGNYSYATIGEESLLILASAARIDFINQLQTGGNIFGATWEYMAFFSADGINQVSPTNITGQIPVSKGNTISTQAVIGVDPLVLERTGKINVLQITNIPPGVYKYVYLKGIEYFNGSISGYSITRVSLTTDQTSVTINHTGNENDTETQDVATLQTVAPLFKTAKNIDIIRNTNVVSNLILATVPDLTDWARTFTHNICKRPIDAIENNFDGNGGVTGVAREFQTASSYQEVGYMINEIQRFGLIARDRATGQYYRTAFWVDDIVINANLQNKDFNGNDVNPFGDNRRNNPNTSSEPFDDNNLTDGTFPISTVYVPYVQFTDIDWNFRIGDFRVGELIDQIQIVRVETVPEVLASGIGIPMDGYTLDTTVGIYRYRGYWGKNQADPGLGITYYFAYPYPTGDSFLPLNAPDSLLANFFTNSGGTQNHTRLSMLMPDLYMTGNYPQVDTTGDTVVVNGVAIFDDGFYDINAPTNPSTDDNTLNYISLFDPDIVANDLATEYAITEAQKVGTGEGVFAESPTTIWTNRVNETDGVTGFYNSWQFESLMALVGTNLPSIFANTNHYRGIYMTQYYRAQTNKYGNIESSVYLDCHAYCDNGTDSVDVFGGDTFTTSHYLKFRGEDVDDTNLNGADGGLNYYCQSRVNPQQRAIQETTTGYHYYYPYNATLFLWLTEKYIETFIYNNGYSIFGQIQFNTYTNFDQTQEQQEDLISAFSWSLPSVINALSRNLRIFPALNLKIEDLQYGGITHHANDNGELISWQPRMFKRHYFNPNNILVSKGGSELTTGDAAIMSQRSRDVTQFGCCNKYGIIKGQSVGGDDIFLWINAYGKSVIRHGADGTVNLSERANLDGYLQGGTAPYDIVTDTVIPSIFSTDSAFEKLLNKDNSLTGTGACGVWDAKRKMAIWSARILSTIKEWDATVTYEPNTQNSKVYFEGVIYLVLVTNTNVLPYDETTWAKVSVSSPSSVADYLAATYYNIASAYVVGDFVLYKGFLYECIVNASAGVLPTDATKWTLIDSYNTDPALGITFAWHERKNKFTTFITPTPKLYIQASYYYYSFIPLIRATDVLPPPIMYVEQLTDSFLEWYNLGTFVASPHDYPLTAKAYINVIKNDLRQVVKQFTNIFVQYSQNGAAVPPPPFKIIFLTNSHNGGLRVQKTTILRADFDYDKIGLIFKSYIKNDQYTSVDDSPSGNTSEMYGTNCQCIFIFNNEEVQYPLIWGALSSLTVLAIPIEVITI